MASPEATVITIELADDQEPVRLRWGPPEDPSGAESAWGIESDPDWGRLEAIRMVSAAFDDGRALGLVALRPRGAPGHGDDLVIARLIDSEGDERSIQEALVSVEYDADGVPRRLGIELWPDAESAPLRVAGDRDESAETEGGIGGAVPMAFRLDGTDGRGLYEIRRRD